MDNIKQEILDALEGKTEIQVEDGEGFQEYCYTDGTRVKAGTTIGFEDENGEFHLYEGIYFKN